MVLCDALSLSLSYTHTHSHSHSHSHTHSHTHTLSLSLSHTHAQTHTLSHADTPQGRGRGQAWCTRPAETPRWSCVTRSVAARNRQSPGFRAACRPKFVQSLGSNLFRVSSNFIWGLCEDYSLPGGKFMRGLCMVYLLPGGKLRWSCATRSAAARSRRLPGFQAA